ALRDQAVRAGLGGDRLAEVDAVVDEAEALSAGSQVNCAIALLRDLADRLEEEGGHPSLVAALRDLAATFTPIPEADLATTLAVDRSTVRVNETVTLTAAVHHRGPDPVTSAELVVTLPAAATATTVPAGCAAPGAVITCDLGALAADGTAEVTIEARPTALGMHEVMATASSELPDPHPDDNTTRVLLEVLAPTPPPLPPPGPPPDPPASPAEVPVIVGDDLVGA